MAEDSIKAAAAPRRHPALPAPHRLAATIPTFPISTRAAISPILVEALAPHDLESIQPRRFDGGARVEFLIWMAIRRS
jgi:hypothetical protein